LNQGTVTTVVGSSGAGKSTIVQLLPHFYEVCESTIPSSDFMQGRAMILDIMPWTSGSESRALLLSEKIACNYFTSSRE
jgi:ABC-type transport system involved in cytochrome bd biosynthesis fused ATPase/permease subunit